MVPFGIRGKKGGGYPKPSEPERGAKKRSFIREITDYVHYDEKASPCRLERRDITGMKEVGPKKKRLGGTRIGKKKDALGTEPSAPARRENAVLEGTKGSRRGKSPLIYTPYTRGGLDLSPRKDLTVAKKGPRPLRSLLGRRAGQKYQEKEPS